MRPASVLASYSGRRVFVTGHTGFKGAWLSAWLHRLGARVTGYSLAPPTNPSLFDDAGLAARLHRSIAPADVRDADAVRAAVSEAEPEVVFHLAAQPLVRLSYADPIGTLSTNVMGTANVLEAVRHCPSVRAVVVVTSDKCYENREWLWGYREDEAMGGHDPYSASKGAAELVTSSYRRSFFHAEDAAGIASARAGNVIGGGDFAADRLVPDLVRAVQSNGRVVIRSPASTRPWQHVLDPLMGYLTLGVALLENPRAHDSGWNFGPRDEMSVPVGDIAARVLSMLDPEKRAHLDVDPPKDAPHEARALRLDCTKARTLLDWAPALSLEDALSWTASFYRGWIAESTAATKLLDQQLAAYTERLS